MPKWCLRHTLWRLARPRRHNQPLSQLLVKRLQKNQEKQNPISLKLILPRKKQPSPSRLLKCRNPLALWWLCAAMIDPDKRNRYLLRQVAVGLAIEEMAKSHRVLTKVVLAIRVAVALTVVIAQSVKIAALALVMLRSELSATPWRTLK
jgi:hypothetical protein